MEPTRSDDATPDAEKGRSAALAAQAPARRGFGALILSFLALAIAIVSLPPVYQIVAARAVAFGVPQVLLPQPVSPQGALKSEIQNLAARVAYLDANLRLLANAPPAAAPVDGQAAPLGPPPSDASLSLRLGDVEKKLTALEASISEVAENLRIQKREAAQDAAKNQDIVKALQAMVGDARGKEKRLAVVLALQSAVINGRSFSTELDWLRQYANDDVTAAATDLLLPYAKRGVAPLMDLRDALDQSDFVDSIRNSVIADAPLMARMQRSASNWLGDIGLMRKPDPLPVDAVLEEMRLAMSRGQLGEALQLGAKLQGATAAMMSPWVARAKARLLAEEITQRLLTLTLQKD